MGFLKQSELPPALKSRPTFPVHQFLNTIVFHQKMSFPQALHVLFLTLWSLNSLCVNAVHLITLTTKTDVFNMENNVMDTLQDTTFCSTLLHGYAFDVSMLLLNSKVGYLEKGTVYVQWVVSTNQRTVAKLAQAPYGYIIVEP